MPLINISQEVLDKHGFSNVAELATELETLLSQDTIDGAQILAKVTEMTNNVSAGLSDVIKKFDSHDSEIEKLKNVDHKALAAEALKALAGDEVKNFAANLVPETIKAAATAAGSEVAQRALSRAGHRTPVAPDGSALEGSASREDGELTSQAQAAELFAQGKHDDAWNALSKEAKAEWGGNNPHAKAAWTGFMKTQGPDATYGVKVLERK